MWQFKILILKIIPHFWKLNYFLSNALSVFWNQCYRFNRSNIGLWIDDEESSWIYFGRDILLEIEHKKYLGDIAKVLSLRVLNLNFELKRPRCLILKAKMGGFEIVVLNKWWLWKWPHNYNFEKYPRSHRIWNLIKIKESLIAKL